MTRNITITQVTEQDYDGNDEDIKKVVTECECPADGQFHRTKEYYSYQSSTADATIESEVNADLTAKGYPA